MPITCCRKQKRARSLDRPRIHGRSARLNFAALSWFLLSFSFFVAGSQESRIVVWGRHLFMVLLEAARSSICALSRSRCVIVVVVCAIDLIPLSRPELAAQQLGPAIVRADSPQFHVGKNRFAFCFFWIFFSWLTPLCRPGRSVVERLLLRDSSDRPIHDADSVEERG